MPEGEVWLGCLPNDTCFVARIEGAPDADAVTFKQDGASFARIEGAPDADAVTFKQDDSIVKSASIIY
jgi:hypothetical protein